MDVSGIWGTQVEIFAKATMVDTPVCVFCKYGNQFRWLMYAPVQPWSFAGSVNKASVISVGQHAGEVIYIAAIGHHFEPFERIY